MGVTQPEIMDQRVAKRPIKIRNEKLNGHNGMRRPVSMNLISVAVLSQKR
jgi:hypothetical protein